MGACAGLGSLAAAAACQVARWAAAVLSDQPAVGTGRRALVCEVPMIGAVFANCAMYESLCVFPSFVASARIFPLE
ncbi:hypothetical protein COCSUDRAFT_54162 [Coccomyxa subellipsoidea C-169]|uniref:Uncharacterized protein n=1 Tax=Coccomyxa subellipsoidea (strain C-169) TaxID=574566 RepID=I0YS48_COCSC|nr:hypothetical protein COCSUDRAFT_54162 [Coccomyxa subellipsoidea C-169]EIE21217.1 hypothetical protein COCSUDRAFT_54162 [Coccomyxa subellipsoidea C-169]|eukprot:XP_005645761.1 hypothetical protein COCSUDRAFT_54162 [Coccomyxa subellipsoidea C-169]